jgi:hypothetical protein
MSETIQATVIHIANEEGEQPVVVLRCLVGKPISPKATVTAQAVLRDQEIVIEATNRVKVLGKGKSSVGLGDTVEIRVVAEAAPIAPSH